MTGDQPPAICALDPGLRGMKVRLRVDPVKILRQYVDESCGGEIARLAGELELYDH